jgi:D-glycero-alpha-D-manno-heptose-7-phosphate kinase
MIITRTPLRISLGGGGTDLPSYYRHFGGVLISGAITRYVYIAINRTVTPDYLLKYSAFERVATVDEIAHPIVREVLRLHPVGPSIELVSLADIPAGTGLGSSGSFAVGLLRAVYAFKREPITAAALAEEACHIEIDLLGRPVGKQDQYAASFGGLTCFEIEPDGTVHASPLMISNAALQNLEEHLLMFFTGYSRNADEVLTDQMTRSEDGDPAMLERLHHVKEIGRASKAALESGDTLEFARLMDVHWQEKRERSGLMSNSEIDRWYELGMNHGALGGKLVGAGGGGYLLFYAQDRDALRQAMAAEGLSEVRVLFDHDGSTVIVRN